jgi:hypothetical protein
MVTHRSDARAGPLGIDESSENFLCSRAPRPKCAAKARAGGHDQTVNLLVAEVRVRLEAVDDAALGDLVGALPGAVPTEGSAQLILRSQPGGVPIPRRAPDRVVEHIRYWQEEGRTVIATGPGRSAAVTSGRAVLDPGDGGEQGVRTLLMPVLALLLAELSACVLHAAGLVGETGGVLVVGGSGQGKSTLVAAALSQRRRILSDDLLVLRLVDGCLTATGIPQAIALPGDQAHHRAVGAAIDGDPRGRHAPAASPPTVDTIPIVAVVRVEHSELDDGHLTTAGPAEVLRWVLSSTLEGLSPGTARLAFPYAAAAARLPAWRLGHAADPQLRLPAAARRLDRICAAGAPTTARAPR